MIKFTPLSVGEVFGYQIAIALGVPVARMQGFWTSETVDMRDGSAEAGRIGVLVEYLADWDDVWWVEAISLDAGAVALALALCAFDCGEWGSFGTAGGRVYFADLERLSPLFGAEDIWAAGQDRRIEILEKHQRVYDAGHIDMIHQVVKEASTLGVSREVRAELISICAIRPAAYSSFVRIVGHPIDTLLSRFAASMFGRRLNAIARYLGQPTYEPPQWR
jgi:hypothetical protein